jgi:hypothetical protein
LEEQGELEWRVWQSLYLLSMTRLSPERRCSGNILVDHTNYFSRLINVLKAANQPVPDELLKFGTTVKRKEHEAYGAFAKDVDMTKTAKKIKFD